jgi:hypothetical protein
LGPGAPLCEEVAAALTELCLEKVGGGEVVGTALERALEELCPVLSSAINTSLGDNTLLTITATSPTYAGDPQANVAISAVSSATPVLLPFQLQFGALTVSPPAESLTVGEQATLSAVVTDTYNRVVPNPIVTWSSSDSGVASVEATAGVVTAISGGGATVTATSANVSGSGQITVSQQTLTPIDTLTNNGLIAVTQAIFSGDPLAESSLSVSVYADSGDGVQYTPGPCYWTNNGESFVDVCGYTFVGIGNDPGSLAFSVYTYDANGVELGPISSNGIVNPPQSMTSKLVRPQAPTTAVSRRR